MKIIESPYELPTLDHAFVTIGNFDGFHLGHRKLIESLLADSRAVPGSKRVVITFGESVIKFIAPDRFKGYLIPPELKFRILENCGFEYCLSMNFREVSGIPSDEFLDLLCRSFGNMTLYVGYNFRFGKGNTGDNDFLRAEARKRGFTLRVFDRQEINDTAIHSTVIRDLVMGGRVDEAAELLGRPYMIHSRKIHGDRIGRTIGFPTLNLAINEQVLPAIGVYFTLLYLDGRLYPSMTYIGTRPSLHAHDLRLETYLLDFDGHIPDGEYALFFIRKTRDERSVRNLEELHRLLDQDLREIRNLAALYHESTPFMEIILKSL
ncbi:MAG: bifunctional riboflavin kinase/FMN adenylyltransferase [Brevinematales bacterium]|nr:bifunctional riboflavin kinase/FMN adenylyltransferase [Brevinematales bacterium]